MNLFRIKIDCDVSAKTPEDALKKLGQQLIDAARPKTAHNFQTIPYDMAKCHICKRDFPKGKLLHLGSNTYRCPSHNTSTVIKKNEEILAAKKKGVSGKKQP